MDGFGWVVEGIIVWNYHLDSLMSDPRLAGICEALQFPSPLLNVLAVGTPANNNICGAVSELQRPDLNIVICGKKK